MWLATSVAGTFSPQLNVGVRPRTGNDARSNTLRVTQIATSLVTATLLSCFAPQVLAQRPQPVAAQRTIPDSTPVPVPTIARTAPSPVGGLLLGAVLGAAVGFLIVKDGCDTRCDDIGPFLYATSVGAAIGGAVGLILGVVARSRVEAPSQ